MSRRETRSVKVGAVSIGTAYPVTLQTMTNGPLSEVRGTLDQIGRCADLGCDIIRAAVDDEKAEQALAEVVRHSPIPLIADIQFHWESALAAIKAGFAGVRLNPGLLRDETKLRAIAEANSVTVLRNGNEEVITMPEEFSLFDLQRDAQSFVQFYNPMTLDSVIPESGAARAGLISGDHILSINDTPTETWVTFTTALNQLRKQESEGTIVNHDLRIA